MNNAPILKSVDELKLAWDQACLAIMANQWYEIHCIIPPELASDPEVKRIIEEIESTNSGTVTVAEPLC